MTESEREAPTRCGGRMTGCTRTPCATSAATTPPRSSRRRSAGLAAMVRRPDPAPAVADRHGPAAVRQPAARAPAPRCAGRPRGLAAGRAATAEGRGGRRPGQAAIRALADPHLADREALLLLAWGRASASAQAAAVVGVRAGTLRVRLHRARARLSAAAHDAQTRIDGPEGPDRHRRRRRHRHRGDSVPQQLSEPEDVIRAPRPDLPADPVWADAALEPGARHPASPRRTDAAGSPAGGLRPSPGGGAYAGGLVPSVAAERLGSGDRARDPPHRRGARGLRAHHRGRERGPALAAPNDAGGER